MIPERMFVVCQPDQLIACQVSITFNYKIQQVDFIITELVIGKRAFGYYYAAIAIFHTLDVFTQ